MSEMKRVFQYHGAEHKAIFCYEADLDLTVENVMKQKRFHPRCGTSFILLMLIVGILWIIPGSVLCWVADLICTIVWKRPTIVA
jgi:uncharacterized protein YqhQ